MMMMMSIQLDVGGSAVNQRLLYICSIVKHYTLSALLSSRLVYAKILRVFGVQFLSCAVFYIDPVNNILAPFVKHTLAYTFRHTSVL